MKTIFLAAALILAAPAWAQTSPDPKLDDPAGTYALCLDTARAYPDRGLELAGKWIGLGGGEPAKHCRAIALIGLKEYAEAASSLEDMAKDSKRPIELRAGLLAQAGQAWFMGEELTKADAALTTALKLLPDEPNLLVDRAEILADAGKYWEAIDDLNTAITRAPSSADAFAFRASAYRLVDAPDLAMEDAERAIALDSTHLGALLERGILYQMQKRPDDARRDWMRILELAPESDAARSARANIEKLDVKPGN
jgi:tetratricopeptide (TPR) repeat protein